MPIASLQLQKKAPVSCREAKRLVAELLSPRFVTILWLCSQLCYYVTAANQRAIVEIELLATVGWKWSCQPFSCPCSQMWCTAEKRSMRHVCLMNPNSRHSFWEFLRAAVRSTSSALCYYYACNRFFAFVEDSGFVSHAEKQRVWSQFCYCDCCKPTSNCRDWAFSNSGLEVGLPALQLPMFANVMHCRKRSMRHVCLRNPNSRHSFWEFLRAAVRSTSSALCFYYACNRFFAFVEDSGFVSHAEKQRVWSQFCYCDCCNANQRTLVEIELLATVGLKWGCQPFSCPWSENVRHCRKEISATCLSEESMPFVKSKPPLPTVPEAWGP